MLNSRSLTCYFRAHRKHPPIIRYVGWVVLMFAILIACVVPVRAADPLLSTVEPGKKKNTFQQYRSQNLIVHTNMPAVEAKAAIKSLEQTLEYAATYWGQNPRGQIECYLLQDLDQISDANLPHRLSRVMIGGVGGATISTRSSAGKRNRTIPTVLASTTFRVADHEIVHAYCAQTFGFTGPCWYREGMAEMAVLRCTRDTGVNCSHEQLQHLRDSCRISLSEVLASDHAGERIFSSMNAMLSDPKNANRQVPLTDWQPQDADNVIAARQYSLRSWALCYMLLHNPNYASRFRLLGQRHVTSNDDSFAVFFASMQKEIAFEYAFFLRNIGFGYRVDLCSWDWNKKFRTLKRGETLSTRIDAKKGYQASGLAITAGKKYQYDAVGNWSTCPKDGTTEANGRSDGRGRLIGIVMSDFELSEPFSFGTTGTFEAPVSGNLYLFCGDIWNELHDNDGQVVVRWSQRL